MGKYTALSNALKYGVPQLFFSRADQLLLSSQPELDFRRHLSDCYASIDETLVMHKQQLQLIKAYPQIRNPENVQSLRQLSLLLVVLLKLLHKFEKTQVNYLRQYRQEHPENLPPDLP